MNFQVNYAPQGATPARRDDAPLYASVAGVAHGMGEGECAFQPRGSTETHVMTTQVLEAVKRVLAGLAQRGLLVSDADLIGAMKAAPARPLAPLAAVFIRACDRPVQ